MDNKKKRLLYQQNSIVKFIFFGNYFYGICVIALAIEANLQQFKPLNKPLFYLLLFAGTVVYYTKAYMHLSVTTKNKRLLWYYENRGMIKKSQLVLLILAICLTVLFCWKNVDEILLMPAWQWLLIILFPIVALLYYGFALKSGGKLNLRNIGWLKPFIIGFTWAGATSVYPLIISSIESNTNYEITLIAAFLFLKNFMFVSLLCIMFDIKDYANDYNQNLKTFVTKFGLRKTIFNIILPLAIVGLGSFLAYGMVLHFSILKIGLNTLPFMALLSVAYSLSNRKSIFYYLIIIDGLMLVKAICGSIAVLFF